MTGALRWDVSVTTNQPWSKLVSLHVKETLNGTAALRARRTRVADLPVLWYVRPLTNVPFE